MNRDVFTEDVLPFTNAKIRLSDGRVMTVIEQHHASPIERWQMWQMLRSISKEAVRDGVSLTFRKRLKMRLMFLSTVLNPDCQACRYGVTTEAPDE